MSHRGADEETTNIHANPTSIQEPGAPFIQTAPSTSPEVSPEATMSPQPTTAADAVNAQNPTVSMTDTGISPAEITVKSGTTITFVNNGQQPHWPASDPHPIHTDLPGFDAKRGLEPGDIYRFTFVKTGSFGMHDHLHPSFHARIIVQ